MIGSRLALLVGACVATVAAQQPQNPSPMVEHTRAHPRLKEETPPGRREALELGSLYLPAPLKSPAPLFVHFHGGTWLPEVAAARTGRTAVISMQLGSGSGAYAKPFADPQLFARLIAEAESKTHLTFAPVTLTAWSAGYGAVREILKVPANYARVDRVLLIDGLHTGYASGTPGTGATQSSQLDADGLQIFLQFARDAVAGRKQMIVTHSEIFPGTFASTTETTDWLLAQLGLTRTAVVKWGPMATQQLSEVRAGKFLLVGYAGNSAPDHVDQLHSLPDYLKWFKGVRPGSNRGQTGVRRGGPFIRLRLRLPGAQGATSWRPHLLLEGRAAKDLIVRSDPVCPG